MTDDRRYSEDEIRRIFDEASRVQEEERGRLPAEGGMTLEEIRRIGAEVGIRPDSVERAALRLRTTKGSARELMTAGSIMVAIAAATAVVALVFGSGDAASSLELGLIGAGLFGSGAIQLPTWAAERERQMEAVARRAVLMAAEDLG